MLDNITNNIGKIIDRISGKRFVGEDDLNQTMREIRIALLEADVSLPIAKDFINKVKEKAVGQEVLKSVSAGQMIIKIVHDELVALLGSEKSEINLETKPPLIIMAVGLQGAGKTTNMAKLALRLRDKNKKRVLLASLDTYRPAAQEQLEILARQVAIDCLEIIKEQKPLEIAARAALHAKELNYDVLILDTAGRTHINEELMQELQDIKAKTNPQEILLVVDSLIGQDAVNVAKSFNDQLGLSGVILTRLDGDGRGGAALTMKAVTNCPIKFIGVGEKLTDLEEFNPDRIASRIVGMGDVVSLVEKAQESFDADEMKKMEGKLKKGEIDLNDLLTQIRGMKKMGGVTSIFKLIPGASKFQEKLGNLDKLQKDFALQEALILSMTKKERAKPDILNSSRKRRIAAGAGSNIQEVNRLLKKHKQMQKITKQVGKMDRRTIEAFMENNKFGL